jgi:hypothetical protein
LKWSESTRCAEKGKWSSEHELIQPTLNGFNIVMMSKPDQTGFSEKRLRPRTKLGKMLRVRQSAVQNDFSELVMSKNVSKDGIYFHTHRSDYQKGMRLLVTFPFTFENDPMNTDYVAEVVRVETLGDYRFGVAIRLISTI